MFFATRRWALRVSEEMGFDVKNPVTTELVSMIIQGTKHFAEMMRSAGSKMKEPELVLMSAASLRGNVSAIRRLTEECGIDTQQAAEVLDKAWLAARKLAENEQFLELLNSRWFRP